ncbi:MAG TPA: hypothetical protein VGF28_12640 [Thermoanaerobaculia bacterium]|jgi:hypothetical protein
MMKPPNQGVDAGGPTAAAAIEILRAVTHTLTPAERLAIVRIVRDGMEMVPPDTDERLRARISVARTVSPQVIDSIATAIEPSPVWQQSAHTNPEELHRLRLFEEHRPLFEELGAFTKILGYNLAFHHYTAIAKSRDAYRTGRNLRGPDGLAAQVHLDAVAPLLSRGGGRKTRKKTNVKDAKK